MIYNRKKINKSRTTLTNTVIIGKIFIWPLQICSQKTSLYGQLIIMYKFKLYLVFRQEEKALDDEYSR